MTRALTDALIAFTAILAVYKARDIIAAFRHTNHHTEGSTTS
jgi:hypothetical protein